MRFGRPGGLAVALLCTALLGGVGVAEAHKALAAGTTYYVSKQGSDSNNGLSSTTSFLTIQKCAGQMVAGDTCMIDSGDYRETVTPTAVNAGGAQITYKPMPGAKVTVDGTDAIPSTQWSPVTSLPASVNGAPDNNLATSPFASAINADPTKTHVFAAGNVTLKIPSSLPNAVAPDPQIFYDDGSGSGPKMMLQAQWPAAPSSEDPLVPAKVEVARDGSNDTTIVDPALTQPAGYWVGALVYVNHQISPFTVSVVASAPGSLTVCCVPTAALGFHAVIPNPGTPAVQAGPVAVGGILQGPLSGQNAGAVNFIDTNQTTRYYLYNKLENVSNPGDWFYDSTAKTLYFRSPSGAMPAGGAVSVKQRRLAFDLTKNVSNTTISGLGIFGASIETGYNVAPGNDPLTGKPYDSADPKQYSSGVVLDSLNINYPSHFVTVPSAGDPADLAYNNVTPGTGATTTGVILAGHGNTIQNSKISNSAGSEIVLQSVHLGDVNSDQYSRCRTAPAVGCGRADPVLAGNTATHNDLRNADYSGSTGAPAIGLIGDNNTITYNTVQRTGRSAVGALSQVSGFELYNTSIAYNDMSGWGMLNLDEGGMYFINHINFAPTDCNSGTAPKLDANRKITGYGGSDCDQNNSTVDFGATGSKCPSDLKISQTGSLHPCGSRIDHNWLHDPLPLQGIGDPSEQGIYIDGGSSNIQFDNNVGWNIGMGTFVVHEADSNGAWGVLGFNNEAGGDQLAADPSHTNPYSHTTDAGPLSWNDGVGWLNLSKGCVPSGGDPNGGPVDGDCDQFINNIGDIGAPLGSYSSQVVTTFDTSASPGVGNLPSSCDAFTTTTNPPAMPACDPGYADSRALNFQLQGSAPARNCQYTYLPDRKNAPTTTKTVCAAVIPGVTGGSTDANPSMGAYQYGAPRWTPGYLAQSTELTSRYGPTRVVAADAAWQNPADVLGLHESPTGFKFNTFMMPGQLDPGIPGAPLPGFFVAEPIAMSGNAKFGYPTVGTDPNSPAFANSTNLAIDHVEMHIYGAMYKQTAASQYTVTTGAANAAGAPIWSSTLYSNTDQFENRMSAIPASVCQQPSPTQGGCVDITSQVAGNWSNLPTWVNVYASIGPDANGWIVPPTTAAFINGLEVVVQSHCINAAAAPCA